MCLLKEAGAADQHEIKQLYSGGSQTAYLDFHIGKFLLYPGDMRRVLGGDCVGMKRLK